MLTHADRVVRSVGRRVAELRIEREMTQQQFADELGVSVQYVQRIEQGGQNLTIRLLVELAEALDVDVTAVFQPPKSVRPRRGRPPSKR